VSLSNREPERSSFDGLRTSGTSDSSQAQDERNINSHGARKIRAPAESVGRGFRLAALKGPPYVDFATHSLVSPPSHAAHFQHVDETVLPVPLRQATSVDRPTRMPPCVRMSNPGTPVVSLEMLMRDVYSTQMNAFHIPDSTFLIPHS